MAIMEFDVPRGFIPVKPETFRYLVERVDWKREAFCGGEYIKIKRKTVAAHRTHDDQYFIDETYFTEVLMDRWIPLTDDRPHADSLSRLLGLSADTIMQIAKVRGLPLRRISRQSTPGVIQSEFIAWVKEQEGKQR